jgi:DNA-binding TFAR19-related protein (PDSD5 family)
MSKNGILTVETKNVKQAKALIKLAAVGNINLTVDEAKQAQFLSRLEH